VETRHAPQYAKPAFKITFRDGGQFRFSYTSEGKIMAFEGHHLVTSIRNGSQVILSPIEK
jgi:outer membrane lipoprotein-sorting protein